jgi:hypothetical protein
MSITLDEHKIGGEPWIALRAHGGEAVGWLKPQEAADLGKDLIAKYGKPEQHETRKRSSAPQNGNSIRGAVLSAALVLTSSQAAAQTPTPNPTALAFNPRDAKIAVISSNTKRCDFHVTEGNPELAGTIWKDYSVTIERFNVVQIHPAAALDFKAPSGDGLRLTEGRAYYYPDSAIDKPLCRSPRSNANPETGRTGKRGLQTRIVISRHSFISLIGVLYEIADSLRRRPLQRPVNGRAGDADDLRGLGR